MVIVHLDERRLYEFLRLHIRKIKFAISKTVPYAQLGIERKLRLDTLSQYKISRKAIHTLLKTSTIPFYSKADAVVLNRVIPNPLPIFISALLFQLLIREY